ncbi:MAG: proton phosphate symporter [Trebouxia sp. A1-2]|nr:MAG: proton phosphate symporter [Trebouxia sp. A1-2]
MASQQYSSELEMANSASLSVYDGDSAYAPKIDPAKDSQLYMDAKQLSQRSPISQAGVWILSWLVPGLGMFSEAYWVFSVGNLKGIFRAEYPNCWKSYSQCSSGLINSLTYTQVAGIIAGQITLGFLADRIGRKWGSVTTASLMLIGGILILASAGNSPHGIFLMYTTCQVIFGYGVGGEYPIASSSAAERAEADKQLQFKRGETVILVFAMQGWGNWFNTMVLVVLLACFHENKSPYHTSHLNDVWRISESAVWVGKRRALKATGVNSRLSLIKFWMWVKLYWHRQAGTALSWFVWDFAFYGNKLFQSTFIGIIVPHASLKTSLEWTLLNSTVALVGYYFAAFTMIGFAWMFVLFLVCAIAYKPLTHPSGIHWFQFLYFFSSFWGQFGPNATTWLLPGELFPTEARAMSHGLSAAVGKAGALVAGVVFALTSDQGKFYISAACGLAGVLCTFLFIPDITGLDLREGDRRWIKNVEGKGNAYYGEAINPRYLSVFERYILGYGRNYSPAKEMEIRKAEVAVLR